MNDGAKERVSILGSALIAGMDSVRRDGRDEIVTTKRCTFWTIAKTAGVAPLLIGASPHTKFLADLVI